MLMLMPVKNRAFSLLEMALVGLLLGALALFTVSRLSVNAANVTRARAWNQAISTVATSYFAFEHHCDLNYSSASGFDETQASQAKINFSASTPPASYYVPYYNVQALLGLRPLAPQYRACYQKAGLLPLTGLTNFKGNSLQGDLIINLAGQATSVDYVIYRERRHLLFSSLLNNDVAYHLWNLQAPSHSTRSSPQDMRNHLEPFLDMNDFIDPSYIDRLRLFDAAMPDHVLAVYSFRP